MRLSDKGLKEGGASYRVDLAVFGGEESCDCPDRSFHPEHSCKHLIAATIYRAKTTARRRHEAEARRGARKAGGSNLTPLAGVLA